MAVITTARRSLAGIVTLGVAPLALTGLSASPAAAHGSPTDPVSRVSACFAEGPENPKSAACRAAVAAGGTQALYDWNGVNIAGAAGKHRELIPDGELCSAGNDKFKGLDLPRSDWPSTAMEAGSHTFRFRATAPHKGTFELYLTDAGYDPSQPLKWSDLQEKPFAAATDPALENGSYVFEGTVPQASGRQLIYTIWQRSDSSEAFYACSDVVFGGGGTGGGPVAAVPAPTASAPSEQDIDQGAGKSSVEHAGHGDDDASTGAKVTEAAPADGTGPVDEADGAAPVDGGNAPEAKNAAASVEAPAGEESLAETGGDGSTPYLAAGGAAALAIGASALFASVRRRAAGGAPRG
ncbi:lytic polysaccharide monooxygenase [Streptomyces sp. B1I3]|uniref:lytic polysaccharide monooxygenase auxiliary activity family 9 protein n=1 Tax=Streptomyces sp. B1I3 TaxID=3042264 RepID=UPI002786E0C4|nr:lytic polysaccharide monooxygenase [Streptomyces sp. B1I3]MDQ0797226.1 chitin-binding protein [Streptomyces sp. B1I3]